MSLPTQKQKARRGVAHPASYDEGRRPDRRAAIVWMGRALYDDSNDTKIVQNGPETREIWGMGDRSDVEEEERQGGAIARRVAVRSGRLRARSKATGWGN